MTKICLIALILVSTVFDMSAQDLIVTQKGDSINATVTKIKNEYVHFVFNYHGEIRRTLLPLDEIHYQKDYFPSPAVPDDQIPEIEKLSKYRIGITGGLSYMTAKVGELLNSEAEDHLRDLKTAVHYGGDFDFFFSQLFGVGIRYRAVRSRAERENVLSYNPETFIIMSGTVVDNIHLQMLGLAFASRVTSTSGKIIFNYNISLGYAHFNNAGSFGERSVSIKSESYWWGSDIGVDIMLDDNLAFGINGNFTSLGFSDFDVEQDGVFSNVNYTNQNRVNWSRVDISLRLVWYH